MIQVRKVALGLGALAIVAWTGVARAESCVPPEVTKRLEACPASAPRKAGKGGGKAPASHRQVFKRTIAKVEKVAKEAGYEISAEQRTFRQSRRQRILELIEQEVTLVNRLIQTTRDSDPRKPDVLFRLAELHVELQTYHNTRARELDDPIYQAQTKRNARRVSQLQRAQRQFEQKRDEERMEAVRTYAQIAASFPDYRRLDETLFYLGYALEELRQYDRARQVYHRLIKQHPQSRYIPNAYLSFAEYYFQEGDMSAALRFYQKVAEFPQASVYGYSIYKQAWCYFNLQEFRNALQQFVATIEFADQNPEARDARNLQRQARMEMVLTYSEVGTPQRAYEFFRRYSGTEETALEMFERLGEIYFDTGKWPETIAVYHGLMEQQAQSPRLCTWQTKVTNAVISSRPKPDQVTEVQRMTDLYETIKGTNQAQEIKNDCRAQVASVLIDLATHWHREAVGTESQPGTNDRTTMQLSTNLYRMIIEKFPDLDTVEFEGIDRTTWPTTYRVSYWYAELLWKMEQWRECGPAFDRVVELDPAGEFVQDAAYASVLCYNNLYQMQFSEGDTQRRTRTKATKARAKGKKAAKKAAEEDPHAEFASRDFTPLEDGMLNAYQRYVCFVPDSEDLVTIKYRRARIYYEANHWEESAILFRDIAWNHRDQDVAEFAANLYLDCLNIIGEHSQPARPQCYDQMAEEVPQLLGFFCQGEARQAHGELCQTLTDLQCGILRKKAEAHQSRQEWREAAATYVRIVREFRECGKIDEVLYNAAINYEAARLLGRAIRVRERLIEAFPESDYAKRGLFLVGANYHALAMYEKAADYYERFASKYPGETGERCTDEERQFNLCPNAPEALQNATFFRLGLGEREKAISDARLYERLYKQRRPAEVARVVYSIGAIYEASEEWTRVVEHYQRWLRTYGRRADMDQRILANQAIGSAYWKVRGWDQAIRAYREVLKLWGGGAAESKIEGTNDEDTTLRRAQAKTAAAEAIFHTAEMEYRVFNKIRFPEYRGGGKKGKAAQELFNKWLQKDFVSWKDRKEGALKQAKAVYDSVVELHIPQWEIAAAARVGDMYRRFMSTFRDAPVPPDLRQDEELLDIYRASLDEASEPWKRAAIGGFEYCLITATRVRWFNEWSQLCEQELNRLDPRAYPLAAEIRAQPTYSRAQMTLPSAVLTLETEAERLEREEAARAAEHQGGGQTTPAGGGGSGGGGGGGE